MNWVTYFIIFAILVSILLLYYYIQKQKPTDLETTYSRYLIRSTNPDTGFTHKKLSDTQYENYRLNYDSSNPDLLVKAIEPYPITSSGSEYKPREHGTVIENTNGFTITGCDAKFDCPPQFQWDTVKKQCVITSLCKNDEVDIIKGLDQYHFDNATFDVDKSTKYHDILYARCLENGEYALEECPQYTIYNQKDMQPATNNPCESYDICMDKPDYTIHHVDIGNGVILKEDEYYMCVNRKSVLKKCKSNSVFNVSANACIELNPCALQPDGFTIEHDLNSYILCTNGKEYTVNCANGVYTSNGFDKLECIIDKSKTIIEYFTNQYVAIPISLYEYANNEATIFHAVAGMTTKFVPLLEDNSGFYKTSRNKYLFEGIEIYDHFVAYENESTKEKGISVPLDESNYTNFMKSKLIQVSYYENALEPFSWNIFLHRPETSLPDMYYKFDTRIKHTTDKTVDLKSSDYFYFNTATVIYRTPLSNTVSKDENSGIVNYADFKVPSPIQLPNVQFTLGYKVLTYTRFTDNNVIFYYVDPISRSLVGMLVSSDILVSGAFVDDPSNSGYIVPTLFNLPTLETVSSRFAFNVRVSSINWYGFTINDDNYIMPEILCCLYFRSLSDLDKQYTILNSEIISPSTDLQTFKEDTDKLYIPKNPRFTGKSAYLKTLIRSIQRQIQI
nr:Vp91 [Menippe mercenaria nudivirus]